MSEQADQRAKLLIALDFLRENHFGEQAEIFEKARVAKPLAWQDMGGDDWEDYDPGDFWQAEVNFNGDECYYSVSKNYYMNRWELQTINNPSIICISLDDGKSQAIDSGRVPLAPLLHAVAPFRVLK